MPSGSVLLRPLRRRHSSPALGRLPLLLRPPLPPVLCPSPAAPTSPDLIFGFESCVCSSSFTRSMGATAVLDTAPATPPANRSTTKAVALPPSLHPAAETGEEAQPTRAPGAASNGLWSECAAAAAWLSSTDDNEPGLQELSEG